MALLFSKIDADIEGSATAAGGTTGKGTVGVSVENNQSAIDLARKTSETLFLREIMFRRCESNMNDSSRDDSFFLNVMQAYIGLADSGANKSRVDLVRELQAKIPAERMSDPKFALLLAAAIKDASKISDAYAYLGRQAVREKKTKDCTDTAVTNSIRTCEAAKPCADATGDARTSCVAKCKTEGEASRPGLSATCGPTGVTECKKECLLMPPPVEGQAACERFCEAP